MAEKKLREQLRDIARLRCLSSGTEETYWNGIKRLIQFHQKRHPFEMEEREVEHFLNKMARYSHLSITTIHRSIAEYSS